MAGIPEAVIDEIRGRADIVEVVSSVLPLKRAGSNYRALCPFHTEKTPSFNVNQDKQIFHCFGCGEGGNVFSFLMKYENLTFPEAIRSLAERYGVTIPESGQGRSDRNDPYYQVMKDAAHFYHQLLLKQAEGSLVSQYVKSRGITQEVIETFELGWAPDSWDTLARYLVDDKKYDKKVAETAGLIKPGKMGHIDRFRGRLMFPIKDRGGHVIAFGGRIITEGEKAAKYLNSPETPIYHKSGVLFGYHEALQKIRKENRIVVAEGYMDVIALVKAGVENAVAVAGTALTDRHAELASRACRRVTLMFDSDTAGVNAIKKSGPILMAKGLETYVAILPGAKDPDEFVKQNTKEQLQAVIEEAPSYPRFVIDDTLTRYDITSVEGKVAAVKEAMSHLAQVKNEVERSQYVAYLSEKTGSDASLIEKEATKKAGIEDDRGRVMRPTLLKKKKTKKQSGFDKAQRSLLSVLLSHPEFLDSVAEELVEEDFATDDYRVIFSIIKKGAQNGATGASGIVELAEEEQVRANLTALSMEKEHFEESTAMAVAKECVQRLKYGPEKMRKGREEFLANPSDSSHQAFIDAEKKVIGKRNN